MNRFSKAKNHMLVAASLVVATFALTACDPPIGPMPGAQPPGHINDTLAVDPGTLPPPPPPPIAPGK